MTEEELLNKVRERFPGVERHPAPVKPYLTLKAAKGELLDLVSHLKDELGFDYFDLVTAVDWKSPVDPKGYVTANNPNVFLLESSPKPPVQAPPAAGIPYRDAFELVYGLSRFEGRVKVFIKIEAPRAQPEVPSLTGLFKAADWQEREIFDLFGVTFEGHPCLKKILTPDFIQGHPLRKDYVHQKDKYD